MGSEPFTAPDYRAVKGQAMFRQVKTCFVHFSATQPFILKSPVHFCSLHFSYQMR
jgi:hypothetical protein